VVAPTGEFFESIYTEGVETCPEGVLAVGAGAGAAAALELLLLSAAGRGAEPPEDAVELSVPE
jgi:hypothetical protein